MHIIYVIKNLKLELHHAFVQLESLKINYVLTADPELKERIVKLKKNIERQNNQLRDYQKKRLN